MQFTESSSISETETTDSERAVRERSHIYIHNISVINCIKDVVMKKSRAEETASYTGDRFVLLIKNP